MLRRVVDEAPPACSEHVETAPERWLREFQEKNALRTHERIACLESEAERQVAEREERSPELQVLTAEVNAARAELATERARRAELAAKELAVQGMVGTAGADGAAAAGMIDFEVELRKAECLRHELELIRLDLAAQQEGRAARDGAEGPRAAEEKEEEQEESMEVDSEAVTPDDARATDLDEEMKGAASAARLRAVRAEAEAASLGLSSPADDALAAAGLAKMEEEARILEEQLASGRAARLRAEGRAVAAAGAERVARRRAQSLECEHAALQARRVEAEASASMAQCELTSGQAAGKPVHAQWPHAECGSSLASVGAPWPLPASPPSRLRVDDLSAQEIGAAAGEGVTGVAPQLPLEERLGEKAEELRAAVARARAAIVAESRVHYTAKARCDQLRFEIRRLGRESKQLEARAAGVRKVAARRSEEQLQRVAAAPRPLLRRFNVELEGSRSDPAAVEGQRHGDARKHAEDVQAPRLKAKGDVLRLEQSLAMHHDGQPTCALSAEDAALFRVRSSRIG
eukprot:NODE_5010_length_1820_cov_6.043709.p1 GENE.NODE_5010_length_1820_cov_6.043709~~NODE_5010_length_1820_cov_6.043709.p1  ORF type:complete len:519 (+),score=183.66 NODE_5010_length_1820_cov_6.043709:107-1663(+)